MNIKASNHMFSDENIMLNLDVLHDVLIDVNIMLKILNLVHNSIRDKTRFCWVNINIWYRSQIKEYYCSVGFFLMNPKFSPKTLVGLVASKLGSTQFAVLWVGGFHAEDFVNSASQTLHLKILADCSPCVLCTFGQNWCDGAFKISNIKLHVTWNGKLCIFSSVDPFTFIS